MKLSEIKARCVEIGDCWQWATGKSLHFRRYPTVVIDGKVVLARRVAYALLKGPIPKGYSILPSCGNEFCVNPAHQAALTESQKGKVAAERGAFSYAVRAAKIAEARRKQMKLTIEQAREIRASEEAEPVLAARYGINKSLVGRIRRGQAWKEYGANPWAGLLPANSANREAA